MSQVRPGTYVSGLDMSGHGGEGGTLGPICTHPPITSIKQRDRRVTDYTDDYTVDYCNDLGRRIARLSAEVNLSWNRTLIQG